MPTATGERVRVWIELGQAVELYVLDCANCGVIFAITRKFEDRRRNDGQIFYCPNGHQQSWHETEADRQRQRAERLKRELANEREETRIARAATVQARKDHAVTKGKLTKAVKRADAGMCQHCHRHFANVQRHVETKHPEKIDKPVPKENHV